MSDKRSKNLVIEVTEPRGVDLAPAPLDGATPEEMVGLKLLPGENNITEVAWRHNKKIKAIKIWIAAGILVDRGLGEARSLGTGLDGLTVKDATAKIASCDNTQLLNDWKEKTESKAIKKLITSQINVLVSMSGK